MTKMTYVLYTLMVYGTSFIFVYISEIIYEIYSNQFKKYKAIFGGAVFGLSLSMVIFIVEYFSLTGIPDGRFAIVLLSTSFFGGLGGLITAAIVFLISIMNNYYEVSFLIADLILHFMIGLLIYQKKEKSVTQHIVLNVIGVMGALLIGILIAGFLVKEGLTELGNIKSFFIFIFPLVGLYALSISVVLIREQTRIKQIFELNLSKKSLKNKNREINRLNNQLMQSENKYKLVLQASDEGFVEYNHYSKIIVLSERAIEIFDHLIEGPEVTLWNVFAIIDEKDVVKVKSEFQQLKLGEKNVFNICVKIKQRDSELRNIAFNGIVNRQDEDVISIVGSIKDIHDRMLKDEMIFELAYKDEVTTMYNENAFLQRINSQLALNNGGNILLISIHGYNDYGEFGISYRNVIRMHLAAILKKMFLLKDCFYLHEGYFCIHVKQEDDFNEIKIKFDYLKNQLIKPVNISDINMPIIIHGIYLTYPYKNTGTEGILSRGLSAMASLEKNNDLELVEFNETIYNKHFRATQIDTSIAKALNNKEFYMVYQPQYDCTGSYVTGYESLMRWNSTVFGFVSPVEFIPIAEKNGTIYKIGQYVIEEVCVFMNQYALINGMLPIVAINVSFIELINPNFAVDLKNTVLRANIPTNHIVVEITETAISEFMEIVLGNIRIIRAFGFEIHLDDFGTGYSSLNHLSKLNVDCVKIDKSFIDELLYNETTKILVHSIIKLSHRIGMKVIAEGIEKKEQFHILRDFNCDRYQGYYFDKPLEKEDILSSINTTIDEIIQTQEVSNETI